jgi:hypothetical protein
MRRKIDSAGDLFAVIEAARADQQVSKRALSLAAGVSPAMYWQAERSGAMRISTTIAVLRVLGLSLEVAPETRE